MKIISKSHNLAKSGVVLINRSSFLEYCYLERYLAPKKDPAVRGQVCNLTTI